MCIVMASFNAAIGQMT